MSLKYAVFFLTASLNGIPILGIFQNLRWNSKKTSLHKIFYAFSWLVKNKQKLPKLFLNTVAYLLGVPSKSELNELEM